MSYSSDDEMSLATKLYLIECLSNKRFRNHPITEKRSKYGEFYHLMPQVEEDPEKCLSYLRMSKETFAYILELVEKELDGKYSYHAFHLAPISPKEKLVVTLRYLATGSSYRALGFSFRMGSSTVMNIVREICAVLWECLQPLHMAPPTQHDLTRIAERYETVWGFPNCLGAIDGKHVRIKCPSHSGSHFFNYKKYFSVVFQGVIDDHYRFTAIDVGGYGKQSDGGTFSASAFGILLKHNQLPIPAEKCLPNTDVKVPHVFITDEAYPLKVNLMKPFAKTNLSPQEEKFNTALSRARKTVECGFGILYSKWRILSGTIETGPKTVDTLIKAMCVLHNTIIDMEGYVVEPEDLPPLPSHSKLQKSRVNNRTTVAAMDVRNKFKRFFSEGC